MSKSLSITSCPICNNSEIIPFLSVSDHLLTKEQFQLGKCTKCSFVFTSNPPSEEHAGKYYETEEYIEHSDNKKGLVNKLYHLGRDYMLSVKLGMIKPFTNQGDSLLDIGSASGYFMNYMKGENFDVTGIEISEKARDLCRDNFKINAFEPAYFSERRIDKKFKVITMWHVLEHVYPLRSYLETIRYYLEKDGVVLIAMPNHESKDAVYYKENWAAYDVPRHLWHFTPNTFENLLKQTGFNLLKMKRLPLDPFYISMVSSQFKNGKTKMLGSALKGLQSFFSSLGNIKKSSSVVYIIQKD